LTRKNISFEEKTKLIIRGLLVRVAYAAGAVSGEEDESDPTAFEGWTFDELVTPNLCVLEV
jgi:hypothetical protein